MDRAIGRSAELAGAWRKKHAKPLAIGIGLACALAVLASYDPATTALYPPCPFRTLTGLQCPGCGSLRALHQLLHGNLLAALRLNPLMVLSLPFLAYYFLMHDLVGQMGRRRLPGCWRARLIWALLGVVVVFWFARNMPWYPFVLLAA